MITANTQQPRDEQHPDAMIVDQLRKSLAGMRHKIEEAGRDQSA